MIFGESPRSAPRTVSASPAAASPARRSFLTQLAALLSAFALLVLAGCGGGGGDDGGGGNTNPSPSPSGSGGGGNTITGRVLDRNGGDRPVAGAVVRYKTFNATSDANGNFRIAVTSGGITSDKVTVTGPSVTGANGVARAGYYTTVYYGANAFGADGFTIPAGTNNLGDLIIFGTDGPPPPPRF